MKKSTLAVILGGGRGTRLYPLTRDRSKPAVPIAGKYRLVDIPISNCLNSAIRRIFVLTQFNSASLNRHIKNSYHFDVFSKGFVDILAAEQTPKSHNWFQGTADAVRQSLHHFENHKFEHVLVLSGDQLYQMDFTQMIKQHKESDAALSVATIPVNADDATGFGIMKTNADGNIENFIEKPDYHALEDWKSEVSESLKYQGKHYLASMGIYIFNKKLLYDLFDKYPDAIDFGKEIIPETIENQKVKSYEYNGYWTDIGTIKSFYEANLELTNTLPSFNLYDIDKMIYTRARLLPASKLAGSTVQNGVIAEGCIIEASRIERSVVGIRSRIGKGTTIEESIIMGNDYFESNEELASSSYNYPSMGIGERCFINNAIIDKNVRIGNDVRIVGGEHMEDGEYENHHVVDGLVIIPKDTILEDGTSIQA